MCHYAAVLAQSETTAVNFTDAIYNRTKFAEVDTTDGRKQTARIVFSSATSTFTTSHRIRSVGEGSDRHMSD
ncbi:MAG TPA: hypothetical protein DCM07_25040 [Planctomycetaceae bacterium]|nr:hypothetical protein [Planctomycetaceae bacterium]HBL44122.1 hypothetical protein [Planctomycetaceae bacterium]